MVVGNVGPKLNFGDKEPPFRVAKQPRRDGHVWYKDFSFSDHVTVASKRKVGSLFGQSTKGMCVFIVN